MGIFRIACAAIFPRRQRNFGPNNRNLLIEIGKAVRALFRGRVAVFGRTALEHVGDENLIATEAHSLGDHVGEQLACSTDERLARSVFVGAGGFSNKHQPRFRVP